MSDLRGFLYYKNHEDINFQFSYEELLNFPIFMIYDIYKFYDELIEAKEKTTKQLQTNMQF